VIQKKAENSNITICKSLTGNLNCYDNHIKNSNKWCI